MGLFFGTLLLPDNDDKISLATHNFHDSHKELPAAWAIKPAIARVQKFSPTRNIAKDGLDNQIYRWGLFCELLPFVEQQAAYDALSNWLLTTVTTSTSIGPWSTTDGTRAKVNSFICPSDSIGTVSQGAGDSVRGRTDYHLSLADCVVNDNTATLEKLRGPFREGSRLRTDMSVYSDGTSNTIVFSEVVMNPPEGSQFVVGGLAFQTAPYSASDCLAAMSGKELLGTGSRGAAEGGSGPSVPGWYNSDTNGIGKMWSEGLPVQTAFNTILPPNSPSCAAGSNNYPSSSNVMITPSSYHSGGVNAGLGDGSVRFISQTIDCGNVADYPSDVTATIVGKSPYGVWGAYGSVKGGESKSL
ncbi:prepilin-type N-terminal cleavage/methylation domain-containing protein [Planctomycetales bacterium]|nr:prepilin-type N-terminal cleavage/methylation domain-containing protein [Planctomycetales bacterium]